MPDAGAYLATVARAHGVPEFWIEDAVQDMRLASWRAGERVGPIIIKRAAIDAARRYGPRTRRGRARLTVVTIDGLSVGRTDDVDARLALRDVRRALRLLSARERAVLARRLGGRPMSNADSCALCLARRRLRELTAA